MKLSLWSVVFVSCLVGESWCQRSRDRTQQQQKKPQTPSQDDAELTDECPEPNGYFADGYQCDKYYECKDGAITEKLCPDGMVFNDYSILDEKCDLPFNIDCTQRSSLQDPKPSPNCPRQNGYFAHEDPKICDKFYFCVDGKYNMITCPSGLVYSDKTGTCTWPDEAKKKHCSSEEGDPNRIRRVAFWKSDEDASKDSEEDSGSYYDSGSVESGRKRKTDSTEYTGSGSAEYPEYGAGSGSAEYDDGSGSAAYDYDEGGFGDDPEFSNFDADFASFANRAATSSGMGFPGLGPHDFIRRKKDSYDQLDGFIKGYVKTIGKDPKKSSMGMDKKYLEKVAEEVVEKEMEEEERARKEKEEEEKKLANTTWTFGTRHKNKTTVTYFPPVNKSPKKKNRSTRTNVLTYPPVIKSPKKMGIGQLKANAPYNGPVLTLKKPVNGVKWSYIPKPGRQLQPPTRQTNLLPEISLPTLVPWDKPTT